MKLLVTRFKQVLDTFKCAYTPHCGRNNPLYIGTGNAFKTNYHQFIREKKIHTSVGNFTIKKRIKKIERKSVLKENNITERNSHVV